MEMRMECNEMQCKYMYVHRFCTYVCMSVYVYCVHVQVSNLGNSRFMKSAPTNLEGPIPYKNCVWQIWGISLKA